MVYNSMEVEVNQQRLWSEQKEVLSASILYMLDFVIGEL